ncbi:MAG: N-acetylmuramoyl-L-alanine amidase [Rhodopseudomonas palustris]|nr:N-acetylmuramoyl-L-alanine amidase [Rhodopseudomonas palustris]
MPRNSPASAARAGTAGLGAAPAPRTLPGERSQGSGPLTVVLDPGHGGIDPGAGTREGINEARLMPTFARELKEALLRDGTFRVAMTREEDVFVPLETRITLAREAGGQVFVSLHADAIAEGEAVGATLYTLADEASDAAAAALAERHDRDDLLFGVDLTGHDDLVATVLMDMARAETGPRNERLALALEAAIKGRGLTMHRHPRQAAGFSVLKSPDLPSILVETGFMSSDADLARLRDPAWRGTHGGCIGRRAQGLGLRGCGAEGPSAPLISEIAKPGRAGRFCPSRPSACIRAPIHRGALPLFRFIGSFFGAIFTTLTLGVLALALTIGAVFWMYSRDLPSHESLAQYTPPTISRIYSGEGRIIDEFAQERRIFAPIEEIPDLVKNAFISAEDKNFYTHHGYDARGIAAAAVEAIRTPRARRCAAPRPSPSR